jgi:hypothetical protein
MKVKRKSKQSLKVLVVSLSKFFDVNGKDFGIFNIIRS